MREIPTAHDDPSVGVRADPGNALPTRHDERHVAGGRKAAHATVVDVAEVQVAGRVHGRAFDRAVPAGQHLDVAHAVLSSVRHLLGPSPVERRTLCPASGAVNRPPPRFIRFIRLQSPSMETAPETVLLDVADGVATITLNRPAVLNAVTAQMLGRLGAVIAEAAADPGAQVIVLTGAGRAFSAGVDLKALGDRSLEGGSVGDILDGPAREAIRLLTTVPKVVIAKVNGACFTGALELALACDFIVVADHAKIADTHAKWGLRPTWA